MNDRLKEAFDKVRAEEELKESVRAFLSPQKLKSRADRHRRMAVAVACCFFLLFGIGGGVSYFMPVSAICVEVNPSVELGINRFDRVVSVTGYNEEGRELANSLNVCFLSYADALKRILEDKNMAEYVTGNRPVSITVVGGSEEKNREMLDTVASCTGPSHGNISCHSAAPEEAAAARDAGMTCGKYRAFLELQKLDPDVTAEEIQGLTMRQIRDRINALSGNSSTSPLPDSKGKGNCLREETNGGLSSENTSSSYPPAGDGVCNGGQHGNGNGGHHGAGKGHRNQKG